MVQYRLMEPQILYEDDSMMVISKPSGVTVNRSDTTTGEKTLQDWVEEYLGLPKSPAKTHEDPLLRDAFIERSGIVHRLDKETSGVMLIAKTHEAFEKLQAQFKERTIKKSYIALAHGKVLPEVGEINVPVGRLPWNRKQFGVVAGGREAVTKYKVIQNSELRIQNEPLSLVELYPETGRTHQIRVHLKHINHPIFADFLYAGRKTARNDRKLLGRVFLHAAKISFTHPTTGENMTIESPLPEELKNVLDTLQRVV
jgi:23S rRNA pseudouridine1911/1915/1917 synthase